MCLMKILDKTLSNYIFQPNVQSWAKIVELQVQSKFTNSVANKIYLLKGVLGIGWKCKWFIENIHF